MAVHSRDYQVLTSAIILIFFQVLVTVLWIWMRRRSKIKFMWSDVFTPASLLFNLALSSCILVLLRYGVGKHESILPADSLRDDQAMYAKMILYVTPPLYLCGVTIPKFSILDLYMHILIDKPSRRAAYAIGITLATSWTVNFIVIMTQCTPFNFPWMLQPGGHCDDIRAHFAYGIIPNIVTDVALLALPIPMVLRLHATLQKKLGIMFIFFFGSLGLVTSVICFVMFLKAPTAPTSKTSISPPYTKTHDISWDIPPSLVWTLVEPGVYHITSCLMMMGPLWKWLYSNCRIPSLFTRTGKTSNENTFTTHAQGPYATPASSKADDSQRSNSASPTSFLPGQNGFTQCSAGTELEGCKLDPLDRYILVEHGFEITES